MIRLTDDRLVVLNEHDGSLTITSIVPENPPETIVVSSEKPVSDGELLFYDARLSHDSWMSCNSCHVDGHSPGLTADTLGDGMFGNPKRIPGLLGVRQTQPFGWLGNKRRLSDQIAATLHSTMHGENIDKVVTNDLVQFVQSLNPAGRKAKVNESVIEPGRRLFLRFKCNECHTPPGFTSPRVQDVGLQDESGNRNFNPPSLRGLGHRRAFFHDARANSLRSVFREYHHRLPSETSDQELEQLLAYLNSL